MQRTKLKKNSVIGDHQKTLSSFFYPNKLKESTPPSKRTICSITEMDSSNVTSNQRSVLGGIENSPLSFDLLSVPETPDSQIRTSHPARKPDDGHLSPICRRPCSRGVSLIRENSPKAAMFSLRSKISPPPQVQTSTKNSNMQRCSVKRLFSSDDLQVAKRPKTMPVKRPSISPLRKPLLHGEEFLSECLQVIDDTQNSKGTKFQQGTGLVVKAVNGRKPSKAGQIHLGYSVLTSGAKEKIRNVMPSLKPLSVKRASSLSSNESSLPSSLSECEEECAFTVITEQKDATEYNGCPTDLNTSGGHVIATSFEKPSSVKTILPCPPNPNKSLMEVENSAVRDCGTDGKGVTSEDHLEGLEDNWFDDKMEEIFSNTEEKSNAGKKKGIPDHVILTTGLHNRYWILDVQEIHGARGSVEKHLTITASKTSHPTEICILKDGWESTPVSTGDVVHLEGQCVSGTWLIDRESGFLVLLPDVLISGTSIASGIRCMRRAVLGEMFKCFDGGSKQMLNGTIVHDIFQKAAMSGDFSMERLQLLANQALLSPNYLGDMYTLKLTQEDMKQEIWEYLPAMTEWARDYLHTSPQAGKKLLTLKLPSDGALSWQDSACSIAVTDFVDIEENIWSPRFGLKGKIDVTAGVRIHRKGRPPLNRVMPLELKTGKESNSIEHRSQVILYTLMSLERRSDAEAGFLLYLKTGNLHPIVGNHMDRRELLKLRNTLAHHVGNSMEKEGKTRMAPLPGIITDRQACKWCPQIRNCALYDRAIESRAPDYYSSESQQLLVQQESEHLTEAHLLYFSHWLLLCALETHTMERKGGRHNIWLQSAQEREKSGGCMGNMQLIGPVKNQSDGVYIHRFERRRGGEQGVTGLIVGDRVVVSDHDLQLIGVAAGYVTDMSSTAVSCSLDRDLSKCSSDVVFRLDQDEGVMGLSTHLVNLSKMMKRSPSSERLRELIVDFHPPQFIDNLSSVLPREAKDTVANILKGLNKPQKQAMKKVLLSKDYTLIVGMPGTGKTTTICTLVRILHACGFSVLLTSYTHSAVDNILLKLRRFKVGFLRLGRAQKVHPDILAYTEERCRTNGIHTLPELENLYNKELVVATTCMGVKHPIFSRRRFDFCIVDEASQISQPVCLGPLFYAQRFVLVGDHQQLPPIVQNREARLLGMDESLFKRLERKSEAVVQLNVQYRMNSKIMSLSNTLMYGGRLECGSERTASAMLTLPSQGSVQRELELSLGRPEDLAWVQAALEPLNPVCFLDTTQVPALETVDQGGISNQTEAALVHGIVSLLLKAGCRASDIGVIAPYRQQLKAISGLLAGPAFSTVEVNTVDKYQGRDKSVIIVSFVRSNLEGNLGELLKDWRRLNVAITRAKHKLLMVGSAPTLRRYAPLEKLLNHLTQESMVFQLPPAAHEVLPTMHL
ncbi:DNA replication ATP-dependent helicase/nuclease DNA2 [Oncorhynchus mykiss]|uniref:DNA replication ATP-dependent helicase/nuclease n=1 Tax=Oncorhynchus mykiss TaxID=8022 RepID=A0A8C7UXD2_ONCMY|nr:DNA replication ATP-dependent helicase/nuclease DNA2 [Oncorhynchus mykiss]